MGLLLLFFFVATQALYMDYRSGAGIYDVTGPVVAVGFMGMGNLAQTGKGLHFRLYARSFVIEHIASGKRTVYMSADLCMIFQGIHGQVLDRLESLYPGVYDRTNVLLHGTHTHSGPGGFSQHPLYDTTTLGYHKGNVKVIVDGIVQSIIMAHNNLSKGGRILINQGELVDANINRGAWAYEQNPMEERLRYSHNTDKTMVLLRLQDEVGKDIGSINFYSVHGTSMFNNNRLVSGDNKGFAAYLFERAQNGWNVSAGRGPFVAAFGQSNEGDVSPNVDGAYCTMPASVAGQRCNFEHSTCAGRNEGCQGQGPAGRADFENTMIIGERQARFAMQLFNNATQVLDAGPFHYVQTYIDMSNVTVSPEFSVSGKQERTCPGGLGDSFAAGTTDGPGAFDFVEGTNSSNTNKYWNWVAQHLLAKPSQDVIDCQYPKPIFVYTQGAKFPCQWSASVLPLQLYRWGNFVILAVPGEFTTMAGRRLRDTVKKAFVDAGENVDNMVFSIAGLAGAYSHYITTVEEYSVQRYAGASTLFGPHTLEAYQQEYYGLAMALIKNTTVPKGAQPMKCDSTVNFLPPVIEDTAPDGKFGSVERDCNSTYKLGDVVNVTFWGSDLRSDFMTNSSYLTVEMLNTQTNGWKVILDDADFVTRLYWERDLVTRSKVTCSWHIPTEYDPVTVKGANYRIGLKAMYKPLLKDLKPYSGVSRTFTLA